MAMIRLRRSFLRAISMHEEDDVFMSCSPPEVIIYTFSIREHSLTPWLQSISGISSLFILEVLYLTSRLSGRTCKVSVPVLSETSDKWLCLLKSLKTARQNHLELGYIYNILSTFMLCGCDTVSTSAVLRLLLVHWIFDSPGYLQLFARVLHISSLLIPVQ